jgi:ribosomal protein S18 acetylase RimI-like enzyme
LGTPFPAQGSVLISIRNATIADAAALAALEERTFRDTFEASNTREDMKLHCDAHFGADIQRRELADPNLLIFVAESDGKFVAFSQLRWGHTPACVEANRPVEIQRFYVTRDWHGHGLAQAMMDWTIGVARERGADMIWLGVWEHNPRAMAFYRKWDFTEVGDHVFQLGTDPQRDIIMSRTV